MARKFSIVIPDKCGEDLDWIKQKNEISQNEAIRQAIVFDARVQREVMNGAAVILRTPDGRERELFFKQ